jgi:hypothetical protein
VEDPQNLDAISTHPVGNDVARPQNNKLPGAGYPTRPTQARLFRQRGDRLEHATRSTVRHAQHGAGFLPDTLGQFRSLYGAAGAQREACRAFYRQGANRLIGDLAAYLRRADVQGTLNIRHPRQAADLFLSMFLGDGHIRGLLMLDMPGARENRALLREAVRVFIAAYAKAP